MTTIVCDNSLYFSPAIPSEQFMEFLDCFWDDVADREFIEFTKWVDHDGMTREKCARHCNVDLDYPFMGLQVSDSIQPSTHSSSLRNKKICNWAIFIEIGSLPSVKNITHI